MSDSPYAEFDRLRTELGTTIKCYVVVGIQTTIPWPDSEKDVEYRHQKLTLRPASTDLLPSIVFQYPEVFTGKNAVEFVRQFMSALAWQYRGVVREEGIYVGTTTMNFGNPRTFNIVTTDFRLPLLPTPQDKRAPLALALYREAQGLNSIPYKFLGFFKILNVLKNTGKEQKVWINSTVPKITEQFAVTRIRSLESTQEDIGHYLYESGRCAVAHAHNEPVVNPEDIESTQRLVEDMPIIRALAEYALENEFNLYIPAPLPRT